MNGNPVACADPSTHDYVRVLNPMKANCVETSSLKRHKEPLPAHSPGVEEHLAVGGKALADVSRLAGIAGHVERKIDKHRRAHNRGTRHEAPVAAIPGIVAIISHHEIRVRRHDKR